MYSQDYNSTYIPSAPFVTVQVSSYKRGIAPVTIFALLDTGADSTMLPLKLLKRLKAKFEGQGYMRGVTGAREVVDIYRVQITVGEYEINGIKAIAIKDNQVEPIIGRDVMQSLIITLNGLAGVTEIKDWL